ncbi:hypothetical protein J437_LFUL013493 [Ladona fulva]|uniref:DUF4795 domain-containing protein n=1 Tax=Ladona fulva TaxID=123851 RepID=A0A8K0KHY0_LADFU|nr:hypothetical protein J437_LFUL013493 [Ladona fulva]
MDRIEIAPLQEVIDDKLRQLEDKVKAMSEKKKDTEACGTKRKLMRNINCISCDKRVAMKTELEGPLLPVLDGIPPNRSMRPFLTYELDHIRKELKSPQCCKGSNFGNVPDDPSSKDNEFHSQIQGGGHYCSRYCGGSHTMITNEQRVRRVGHFPDENFKGILSMAEKPQKKK